MFGDAGHIHAYERTYQTYNYQADGCAPRFITIGEHLTYHAVSEGVHSPAGACYREASLQRTYKILEAHVFYGSVTDGPV